MRNIIVGKKYDQNGIFYLVQMDQNSKNQWLKLEELDGDLKKYVEYFEKGYDFRNYMSSILNI